MNITSSVIAVIGSTSFCIQIAFAEPRQEAVAINNEGVALMESNRAKHNNPAKS